MNYRLILLDYFYQYLNKQGVNQASFCFLDRKYNSTISKTLFDNQLIDVYHLNPPRVFNKKVSLNQLENSFVELSLTLEQDLVINKDDEITKMKDPYYLKSPKNIDFNYIHINRIVVDNIFDLIIISYANNDNLKIDIPSLKKLVKELNFDLEYSINNKLNEFYLTNNQNYLIYNDNSIYLSDNIKNHLNIKHEYYSDMDNNNFKKVLRNIEIFEKNNKPSNEEEFFDSKIKFYNIVSKDEKKLYSKYELLNKKIIDHYSLMFLEECAYYPINFNSMKNIIEEVLIENNIINFELYDTIDSIMVYVPYLVEQLKIKKIENELLSQIQDLKFISLNTAYDLGLNVDLEILISYLKENNTFDKTSFKQHLMKINESKYLSTLNIVDKLSSKYIVNSLNDKIIGTYIGYVHQDLNDYQKKHFYNYASVQVMEIIKENYNKVSTNLFFRCSYELLKTKRIWNILKKLTNNNAIIISEVSINSKDELNKLINIISKLRDLSIEIYFDSSLFTSIMLSDLINLYDGIYVEDYEMALGFEEDENLFKEVITFYMKENKKIILNDENNCDLYRHPNILIVKNNVNL